MLEHMKKGLQQQHLLNRCLVVGRELGIRSIEKGGFIHDIKTLEISALETRHPSTLFSCYLSRYGA